MPDKALLRSTKGMSATPLRHLAHHIGRASDGGSEGMASPDPSNGRRSEYINIDSFPTEVCEME